MSFQASGKIFLPPLNNTSRYSDSRDSKHAKQTRENTRKRVEKLAEEGIALLRKFEAEAALVKDSVRMLRHNKKRYVAKRKVRNASINTASVMLSKLSVKDSESALRASVAIRYTEAKADADIVAEVVAKTEAEVVETKVIEEAVAIAETKVEAAFEHGNAMVEHDPSNSTPSCTMWTHGTNYEATDEKLPVATIECLYCYADNNIQDDNCAHCGLWLRKTIPRTRSNKPKKIVCLGCGEINKHTAMECRSCRVSIGKTIDCLYCGVENDILAIDCASCGLWIRRFIPRAPKKAQ